MTIAHFASITSSPAFAAPCPSPHPPIFKAPLLLTLTPRLLPRLSIPSLAAFILNTGIPHPTTLHSLSPAGPLHPQNHWQWQGGNPFVTGRGTMAHLDIYWGDASPKCAAGPLPTVDQADLPNSTTMYRFTYPTPMCMSNEHTFLHDMRTCVLMPMINVNDQLRLCGGILYADVSKRHALVCAPHYLPVYAYALARLTTTQARR